MSQNTTSGPNRRPPTTLQLSKAWTFRESRPIGTGGGFGDVFEGQGPDGEAIAVKRIRRIAPGLATGEIKIARALMSRPTDHVIPILDAGEDATRVNYYVVMPLAEGSLQDRLDREGPLVDQDAMAALQDVLSGLREMGSIVHGDLKPANVLFHESRWKLADMGIARSLDEAPSPLSARMFVSAPYAAPEQWRFEAPTKATDVYAFGCLAYDVLTGETPFLGPTKEDYCVQHLQETPRMLAASPAMRALVQMCLAKDRAARPSVETVLVLLNRAWGKG